MAATAVALVPILLAPTDGFAQDGRTRRVILSELPMAEQVGIATLAETTGEEAENPLTQAREANLEMKYRDAGELFERSGQLRTPGDRRGMEGFQAADAANRRGVFTILMAGGRISQNEPRSQRKRGEKAGCGRIRIRQFSLHPS